MNNEFVLNNEEKKFVIKDHIDALNKQKKDLISYLNSGNFNIPENDVDPKDVVEDLNIIIFNLNAKIQALEQIRDNMV